MIDILFAVSWGLSLLCMFLLGAATGARMFAQQMTCGVIKAVREIRGVVDAFKSR